MPPPRAPSEAAALAARALARIKAAALLVHDRLVGAATVMHHTQMSCRRRRCPGCHKESTCESSRDEPSRSVDEFGDRMLGCKSSLPTRTRLWHDPLVEVWLMLARMAGLSCG